MQCRPTLGSTQPPIQWVSKALSPGLKRPGREADHSPTASAECIYFTTASGQLQGQHDIGYRTQDNKKGKFKDNTKNEKKRREIDHSGLFTLKCELLEIVVCLHTALALETYAAEGQ
jgi:hypothetical protein